MSEKRGKARLINWGFKLDRRTFLPPAGRRNICCANRLPQTLSAECGGSSKRFAFSNKKTIFAVRMSTGCRIWSILNGKKII